MLDWLCLLFALRRDWSADEFAGSCDVGDTAGVDEQAIVPDAVEAFGQDVDEEAADELMRLEGHGLVSAGTLDTVVLDLEGVLSVCPGGSDIVDDRTEILGR